jgi:hypothetical protein
MKGRNEEASIFVGNLTRERVLTDFPIHWIFRPHGPEYIYGRSGWSLNFSLVRTMGITSRS